MTNNIKKIAAVYISAIFKFQIILSFRILLFFSSNDECICSSKQTNVKNAHRSVHFRLKTKLLGALPQTLFRELFEKSSLKTLKNFNGIIYSSFLKLFCLHFEMHTAVCIFIYLVSCQQTSEVHPVYSYQALFYRQSDFQCQVLHT